MTPPPLGLDVAKLKFNACLVRQGGRPRHRVFTGAPRLRGAQDGEALRPGVGAET